MSTFFLINCVTVATTKVFAGDIVDDTVDDAAGIRSAGGLLWPSSNAVIGAAAAKARSARINRGASEIELNELMQSAVDAVQLSADTAGGVTAARSSDLTAFVTAGMAEGAEVYVQSYRQTFKLSFVALVLRPNEVIASDDPTKVWVRDMTPSSWTFQYVWYYNKDTGSDEADGATRLTPIKTLDEWCRRIRMYSGGIATVLQQYTINLQTDVASSDTWFPSALCQADTVKVSRAIGGANFVPIIVGFRQASAAVPGGTNILTAASALTSVSGRTKATLIDSLGDFTTAKGKLVSVADTATPATGTGAVASLTASGNLVTLTGGTGFTVGSMNRMILISGAADPANNGAFIVKEFLSTTSVLFFNPGAPTTDANNGAIGWTEKNAKIAYIINAPAFTTGAGSTVTAVNSGLATLAGFPAATFTSAAVGKRIRFSGGIAANTGDFTITRFISATSVEIANVNAVVDATVMTHQGVVEVGPNWFDSATLLPSAAAPSSGSPYAIVQYAIFPCNPWGWGGAPWVSYGFSNLEITTTDGPGSDCFVRPTFCRMTAGGMFPGRPGANTQSTCIPTLCAWNNPAAGFADLILQENGAWRPTNSVTIGYNIQHREGGTAVVANGLIVQGGFYGLPGSEPGGRLGTAVVFSAGVVGVFNNVEGSLTNPPVGTGSAGAAFIFGRGMRASNASGSPLWGIGALIGLHHKENADYYIGATAQPNLTDSAGQAGFPVNELKIDGQAPITVPSAVTGVPTAVATTAGVATTFVVGANGIVTITDPAAVFSAASVGRTVTIAGANTAANNGTYPIESFIGATQVTVRNMAGVTDAVPAGTMTENPVITRFSQLFAAPYSGNAVNHVNGTKIVRIAET